MTRLSLTVTVTAIAALSAATFADAKVSTGRELKGFDTCMAAAEQQFAGLKASSDYFFDRTSDRNVYYINATATENGKPVNVKISCDTSRNGRSLLSHNAVYGHFDQDPRAGAGQVAAQ